MQPEIARVTLEFGTPLFEKAWQLYLRSFPIQERRDLVAQEQIMKNDASFHSEALTLKGEFIGLLFWWNFEKLCFIEHFAISSKFRNKGLGKIILEDFSTKIPKPVLLEVEIPKRSIQKRRISFYERLGFHLNNFNYIQPPYRAGEDFTQLLLMSFPIPIYEDFFTYFTTKCFPEIYKIPFQEP